MIVPMPRHLKSKIIFVLATGFGAFLIAYFIDQYYILGKGWWFLLELVS